MSAHELPVANADALMRQYAKPLKAALEAFLRELSKEHVAAKHVARKNKPAAYVELTPRVAREVTGIHLRRLVRARGMTQKDLASRLGVNPSVITRVFARPDRARVETLQRIADALGVPLGDLLAGGISTSAGFQACIR